VFIGTGEHLDDLDAFKVESFVSRLLGMGDVSGLVNAIKEAGIDKWGGGGLADARTDSLS
jgi:signal recognition particle subunit SRP54